LNFDRKAKTIPKLITLNTRFNKKNPITWRRGYRSICCISSSDGLWWGHVNVGSYRTSR